MILCVVPDMFFKYTKHAGNDNTHNTTGNENKTPCAC